MNRQAVRATELALALMLGACVGKTDFVDPPTRDDDPSNNGDGDNGDGDGDNGDGDGDDKANPAECIIPQAVYFGTTGPTAVPLSDDQVTAIGMLTPGNALCSGTLVRRDWVLTAKHCTVGTPVSQISFQVAREFDALHDFNNGAPRYAVAEKFENPDRDTTLLHLASSPLDDDPSIQPIRINGDALEGREREIFEAAGYGERENGDIGSRYFTAEPVEELTDEFVSVNGEGKHGLCGGDSGGPLFANFDDGVRVVGELLGGDESCTGVDTYTRTDKQIDWINSILGDDGNNRPCGNVSEQGRCDADVASWCEGGTLRSESCASEGKVCKLDSAQGGYRCVDEAECGNVTSEGECDSMTARWCENGKLQTRNCASEGLVCGQDPDDGNTRCIEDPCAGISGGGECQGDVAVVCVGQSRLEVDCKKCGLSCEIGAAGPECD